MRNAGVSHPNFPVDCPYTVPVDHDDNHRRQVAHCDKPTSLVRVPCHLQTSGVAGWTPSAGSFKINRRLLMFHLFFYFEGLERSVNVLNTGFWHSWNHRPGEYFSYYLHRWSFLALMTCIGCEPSLTLIIPWITIYKPRTWMQQILLLLETVTELSVSLEISLNWSPVELEICLGFRPFSMSSFGCKLPQLVFGLDQTAVAALIHHANFMGKLTSFRLGNFQ